MELENGRIRINIDARTGGVRSVQDVNTGIQHLRVDEPFGLFRILAPTKTWWARYVDAHEQASPTVREAEGGLNLRYDALVAADGEAPGISAELHLRRSERKDEILITLSLENSGSAVINEVRCPWVGGWKGIGGKGKDRMVLGARNGMDPHSFPRPAGNTYARNHQRLFMPYPVSLFAPWADISGPGGGMALLNYMSQPQNGGLVIENLAGYAPGLDLAFGWAYLVQLDPGMRWESPPMGIAVHGGDWHDTADRYRNWFEQHSPPDLSRPDVRTMIGFQNVFFRGFDGTPIRPLDELPSVAAAGRRYGVDHLCVWDTLTLGNYAKRCARDLTEYPAQERVMLRENLAQAEREGTSTSALINFRHPLPARAVDEPAVGEQVQRRFDGTYRTENWAASHHHCSLFARHLGPESWVYSPFSSEHRERVMGICEEYIDLGYTSMFYDQPFEIHGDYGFTGAGHRPEDTHAAALDMIRAVRERILDRDPNAIIIGEECDVFAGDAVDLWMSWRISDMATAPDVAITRYSIPHAMLSWVIDHERERATLAFAMGMYLCLMIHGGEGTLDDEPELAHLVSGLAELRKATAARTVMGRFVHHHGIEIDGGDSFVAFSYDSPDGPAVIGAAPGGPAAGVVRIDRDAFSASGTAGKGTVFHLDGSRRTEPSDVLELSLEANEVAVWLP